MPPATHALLSVILLFPVAFAGCLGGSPEACPPHHEGDGPAMELLTEPDIYQDGEGWSLLLQCATEHQPLAAYRFTLEVPSGRILVVEPVGTWSSPAVFYAPTNGTEEGAEIRAVTETPGNEGDPTWRFELIDSEQNGVFDPEDNIRITYDAGAVGVDQFDAPFEGGQYEFSVYQKEGDVLVARVPKNFPDPAIGDGSRG